MDKNVILQSEILEIRNKLNELLDKIVCPYGDLDNTIEKYRYLSQKLESAINDFQRETI